MLIIWIEHLIGWGVVDLMLLRWLLVRRLHVIPLVCNWRNGNILLMILVELCVHVGDERHLRHLLQLLLVAVVVVDAGNIPIDFRCRRRSSR